MYVRLDVSLNAISGCVVDEMGAIVREGAVGADGTSIYAFAEPWRDRIVRVDLEAGSISEWITAGLTELGLSAIGLEARRVKAAISAMPVKTDRNDARGIAQVERTEWYKTVHVKSIGSHQVRTLAAARSISFVRSRQPNK